MPCRRLKLPSPGAPEWALTDNGTNKHAVLRHGSNAAAGETGCVGETVVTADGLGPAARINNLSIGWFIRFYQRAAGPLTLKGKSMRQYIVLIVLLMFIGCDSSNPLTELDDSFTGAIVLTPKSERLTQNYSFSQQVAFQFPDGHIATHWLAASLGNSYEAGDVVGYEALDSVRAIYLGPMTYHGIEGRMYFVADRDTTGGE